MKRKMFARVLCAAFALLLLMPLFFITARAEDAFDFNKYLATGRYTVYPHGTHDFSLASGQGQRFVGDGNSEEYFDYTVPELYLYGSSLSDWILKQDIKIYAPEEKAFFSVIPQGYVSKSRTVRYVAPLNYENSDDTQTEESRGQTAYGRFTSWYHTAKYAEDESMPYLRYKNINSWNLSYDMTIDLEYNVNGFCDPEAKEEFINGVYNEYINNYADSFTTGEITVSGVRVITKNFIYTDKSYTFAEDEDSQFYPTIEYAYNEYSDLTEYLFIVPVEDSPVHYAIFHLHVWDSHKSRLPTDQQYVNKGALENFEEYNRLKNAIKNEVLAEAVATKFAVEYGEIVQGPSYGELTDEGKKPDVIVDTDAEKEKGEDGGTTIPDIIVLGTLGVAASLAAAAAYTERTGYETKPSRFKMYINKNFGDKLKKGAEPEAVFARICEIKPGGEEVERVDLTRKIQVYSSDNSLTVTDGGMTVNGYRCAMAAVPDGNAERKEGVVSFFFAGEGGTFTQNVRFRILGESAIVFPEQAPDQEVFIKKGIRGDGEKYQIEFVPDNFLNEPTNVKVTTESGEIGVSFRKDDKGRFFAVVDNKTAAAKMTRKHFEATADYREHTVLTTEAFSESVEAQIHVFAANGKEKAEADFKIEFYPEGISVKVIKGKAEDGKLLVDTRDKDGVFTPVEIRFIRASKIRGGGAEVDDDVDVETSLEYFDGHDDTESVNVLYGFDYEISPFTYNKMKAYRLLPKVAIPDNGHDCYTFKWAAIAAGSGHAMELELPVRLTGEMLDLRPVEERNTEIALLKRAIERYGLHGDARSIELSDHLNVLPASVIKQMRAQVLKCAINYYSREAKKEENFAAFMSAGMYSCMVFDWLGQQAFSYIMKVYVGDVGEMLITPIKNAIVNAAADNIYCLIWGEPFKDHFTYEKIVGIFEEMAENFLIDALFGNIDWTDLSKAGTEGVKLMKNFSLSNAKSALLQVFGADYSDKLKKGACFCAAFSALNFMKHYTLDQETKDDFGKSIVATFNDCTMNTLKQVFSKFVTNWLKKKYGLSEITWGEDGAMNVNTYTVAPLEKYIKSKFTVGDISLFGKQLTGTQFLAFGKQYDFFKTTGDNTGTLVGVGVDAVTGLIVDLAPDAIGSIWKMVWDSKAGCFVLGVGNKLYALTIKDFVDAAFKQLTEYYEVAKFTISNAVPLPSFIPPADESGK